MHDARNVGRLERYLSLGAGALLVAAAIRKRGVAGTIAAAAGGELLYRGITGFCPAYGLLGFDTSETRGSYNPNASVPYGRGVRVEQSIEVGRPASELYEFWRKLDSLPQFMQHLEEVTVLTAERSRWRVRAPVGSRITWEAEIINDVPGQLIGWRSLPGSAMHNAGSVQFVERDGVTEVRVELEYAPPARYVGASLARILGEEPHKQIAEDLRRFKAIVERGEHVRLQ
ncbi:MAG TPA: YgaP-like transmembrane domain [Candidatus Baltobacteraceae bacterium]|nr:YgaP-like transmembrane domain [Candidatus Baltobacteraceae bacterium]